MSKVKESEYIYENGTNMKHSDCEACDNAGWFPTNQSDGRMGISRCDACLLFDSDYKAQLYVIRLLDVYDIEYKRNGR